MHKAVVQIHYTTPRNQIVSMEASDVIQFRVLPLQEYRAIQKETYDVGVPMVLYCRAVGPLSVAPYRLRHVTVNDCPRNLCRAVPTRHLQTLRPYI